MIFDSWGFQVVKNKKAADPIGGWCGAAAFVACFSACTPVRPTFNTSIAEIWLRTNVFTIVDDRPAREPRNLLIWGRQGSFWASWWGARLGRANGEGGRAFAKIPCVDSEPTALYQ